MSAFQEVKASLKIHLHPSRMSNIVHGVVEQLNEYLMNYVDELGGVVISFSDLRIPEPRHGTILNEYPHVHFDISVKFVVFSPQPGDQYQAVVNKVGTDHIGALLFGVFHVAVPKRGLPAEYKFDPEDMGFHKENATSLLKGSTVKLQVTKVQNNNDFFSMEGCLNTPGTSILSAPAPEALDNTTSALLGQSGTGSMKLDSDSDSDDADANGLGGGGDDESEEEEEEAVKEEEEEQSDGEEEEEEKQAPEPLIVVKEEEEQEIKVKAESPKQEEEEEEETVERKSSSKKKKSKKSKKSSKKTSSSSSSKKRKSSGSDGNTKTNKKIKV